MQYYFAHYLLRINLVVNDEEERLTTCITSSLQQILHQLIEVILQLDDSRLLDYIHQVIGNPFPTKIEFPPSIAVLLSLYYSAMLIDSTITPILIKEAK